MKITIDFGSGGIKGFRNRWFDLTEEEMKRALIHGDPMMSTVIPLLLVAVGWGVSCGLLCFMIWVIDSPVGYILAIPPGLWVGRWFIRSLVKDDRGKRESG